MRAWPCGGKIWHRRPGGGTWLGGWDQDHADYVSRNDGEYFAEGTAGYFDYSWPFRL
ncbi:MAG: hypothetical protein ACOC8X_06690 [Chloroflexota bacterium]